MFFKNRREAGKLLAQNLSKYKKTKTIVLGIPRGGVVVAYEISKELSLSFNIVIARKISHPARPEFGLGAIGEGNVKVLDRQSIDLLGFNEKDLADVIKKEKVELRRRIKAYRQFKPFPVIKNRQVILIDDGLATGVSAKAALYTVKKKKPARIIFVTPVCSKDISAEIESMVDNFICLNRVEFLQAIALWYQDFSQVTDEEVLDILKKSKN